MTMKITQITNHWEADEALSIIQFLRQLHDLLWAAYGDQIMRQREDLMGRHEDQGDLFDPPTSGEDPF